MTVELMWEGKYDASGRKRSPLKIALPFQTVETVNESAQERQRLLLFGTQDAGGGAPDWRNRLIWGDKKYVLPSLLPEFAGKVNLIYIDPPFDTGANFSFQVEVEGEHFTKEPSIIEQKAYRDTWGRGLDSYLQWFYETVVLLRELLAEDGSIYVHLDWHVGHYAKTILDEVFSIDRFINEIIWKRTSARSDSKTYNHIHDVIFFYTKNEKFNWTSQFTEHSEEYKTDKYAQIDENGRRYVLDNMTSPNPRPNMMYEWKGYISPEKGWRFSIETMTRLDKEGRIWYPEDKTKRPRFKRYLDELKGRALDTVWTDIFPVNSQADERVDYRTQKPEALLERIIKASSNEGDLVLDCFCGSGTTAAVAEKLNRRWMTCDLGRFAIHTARKRLLAVPGVKPFVVQNLGKYERQAWQQDEFGDEAAARLDAYTRFILELYRAQPLDGFTWLHGVKAGRVVHVGAVDSPVTLGDVKAILLEWRRNYGKTPATKAGIDVLGWEFALDMNETARQQAQEAGVDLRFCIIPREVLEKKAVEQGDIQFFELAALFVETKIKKREMSLALTNFIAPLEYVPQEVRARITRWEAWIDYWAVDFDFQGDTFHNQWQSYRTRKEKKLALATRHTYAQAGDYLVQVKVIDILGNDTTRTLKITVP